MIIRTLNNEPLTEKSNSQSKTYPLRLLIPHVLIGSIIGKGGAKINEIRTLSGSVIKINEPQDNSNERLVTITGTQECNQMTLYMLYSRLGENDTTVSDSPNTDQEKESEKHRI